MTSGSLTQGRELEEDPSGSDATPFPEKDVVMMVYNGCPPSGRHHVSNLCLGTPPHCVGDPGTQGCKGTSFFNTYTHTHIYVCMYVCIICEYVYYNFSKREKQKNDRQDSLGPRGCEPAKVQSQGLAPEACSSCRCSRMGPATAKTS
jgi:hypothetical protein